MSPFFRLRPGCGGDRGAAAVEFAFIAPAFLMLLIGTMQMTLVMYTAASLHYAVKAAARCASLDSCGAGVTTYAMDNYLGPTLTGNPFAYNAAAGCGHQVTANYTYDLKLALVANYSIPLSAAACFP